MKDYLVHLDVHARKVLGDSESDADFMLTGLFRAKGQAVLQQRYQAYLSDFQTCSAGFHFGHVKDVVFANGLSALWRKYGHVLRAVW